MTSTGSGWRTQRPGQVYPPRAANVTPSGGRGGRRGGVGRAESGHGVPAHTSGGAGGSAVRPAVRGLGPHDRRSQGVRGTRAPVQRDAQLRAQFVLVGGCGERSVLAPEPGLGLREVHRSGGAAVGPAVDTRYGNGADGRPVRVRDSAGPVHRCILPASPVCVALAGRAAGVAPHQGPHHVCRPDEAGATERQAQPIGGVLLPRLAALDVGVAAWLSGLVVLQPTPVTIGYALGAPLLGLNMWRMERQAARARREDTPECVETVHTPPGEVAAECVDAGLEGPWTDSARALSNRGG